MALPPPGWLPDPSDVDLERYWDGWQWTTTTRPVGGWAPARSTVAAPRTRGTGAGATLAKLLAGLAVGLLAFAGASYALTGAVLGHVPPWSQEPTGPDVRYPVFGSTELVQFFERHLIVQDERIDVSDWSARGVSKEQLEDALLEAVNQNPYIYTWGAQIEYSRLGAVFAVRPRYLYTDDEAARRQLQTQLAVDYAIQTLGITDATPAADKARVLYDYVASVATYDRTAADLINAGADKPQIAESQEAYGILVDGTAVCNGYAHAYSALAKAAGLDVVVVTGEAWGWQVSGGHAWNKVRIDGRWLTVDTTWGDAGTTGDPTYLLVPDGDPALATREQDAEWVVDENLAAYATSP